MSSYTINENGISRPMTAGEKIARQAEEKIWSDGAKDKKLAKIKEIRLEKLQSTDFMANSDYTMPDYIKTWRQQLRDLPQNNTTESEYDTLLESEGTFPNARLKNSIWTQPTS